MTHNIDLALEQIYARRRRQAFVICFILMGMITLTLSIYPELFSSILPIPEKTEEAEAETKEKKEKKTVKKRRVLPKELKDKLIDRKKEQLRKRMLTHVRRMQKEVENLERIERERMAELNNRRDAKQDLIDRLKELNKIVSDKAHTHHNKNDTKTGEEVDKKAQKITKSIETGLDAVDSKKKPTDTTEKPADAQDLTKLANDAKGLADDLDRAADTAKNPTAKTDAKQAAAAARAVSQGLEKLAGNKTDDINDGLASQDTNPLNSSSKPLDQRSIEELHDISQDLADQANGLYSDIKAAQKSKEKNIPFNDALASSQNSGYERSELNDKSPSDTKTDLSAKPSEKSVDAFNQYSKNAIQGVQKAARSISRQNRLADPSKQAAALASILGGAGQGTGKGMGMGAGEGNGTGGIGSGRAGVEDPLRPQAGGEEWDKQIEQQRIKLNAQYWLSSQRIRDILPARRFSKSSLRKGWFYIDTWYVIGPWKAPWASDRVDYRVGYPPEQEINLEANYGKGSDGQPLEWRFRQFDSVLMAMDPQWKNSVYYLYTELYFEEEHEMVLSIAADDAAKVWINDVPILEEKALSNWNLNENFNKVLFRRGFNKVLIRLQNGPSECDLSVILCSENLVKKP